MFVISQSSSYWWPVKVEVPTDGGKWSTQTFDAEFKRLPQSRIDEIRGGASDDMKDGDLAREVVVGWRGINDADGNEVPFSDAMLAKLLDVPTVGAFIVRAYIDSLTGAKRKN